MPTRLRKVRRLRGSRYHGYGQVGQHRKSGSRGGRGQAGLHKHKWSWTVKYDPDHFGSSIFHPPQQSKLKKWVNVGQLDGLYAKIRASTQKDGDILDLASLGYQKLLGRGEIKGAYKIRIAAASQTAKEKLSKSGCELVGK